MLWEVEIRSRPELVDREADRVLQECRLLGAQSITQVHSARSFLLEGPMSSSDVDRAASELLVDFVAETHNVRCLTENSENDSAAHARAAVTDLGQQLSVLFKPGVTDNTAASALAALRDLGLDVTAVATCRKYHLNGDANPADMNRLAGRVLANDAIERVLAGPLTLTSLAVGHPYQFELITVPIRGMDDAQLAALSRSGQLYLSLPEMQTIQAHFVELNRDPTDAELETIAQTWSEHCSHKTLAGRIHYRDDQREIHFENMLKETIFAATVKLRQQMGANDWCVSVFKDNAGVIRFNEQYDVCFKVETHNHPSALEPYGGANTGLGGVIRDPLGTGLGAKPICSTDVFCFAPPDMPYDQLPPGVLHPRAIARGVVSGVRDYGNRMGIPTVNGAVYFDARYLGNPLVFCGNVALLPVGKAEKRVSPGDYIVAVGGRTGRDGIHGATFSSAELTHESEALSGGAVQIGNAITEKMLADVVLQARDLGLYSAITDCGAGGFSSAVGEMGEETGAEVWLERPPLKYAGLSYTEIWISEAQERMVLSVPPGNWEQFESLCAREGVEATVIGQFTDTQRLVLKYNGQTVADLAMAFLHDGRPPVIRDAVYSPPNEQTLHLDRKDRYDDDLSAILSSLNVCSKEWIIRQYDHEVQAGSVVKPLVGRFEDGPSDAAVVRPVLDSSRGIAIACGMNPRWGDFDPYWMAASAIDEAIRNCVAVGADPDRIAILDNFCWGNTERAETLGSLVRAALACQEMAIAFGVPFISGKDSLNNEFSYVDGDGTKNTVSIPPSLLISAIGQLEHVEQACTMDLKRVGSTLYLLGTTADELGGSHFALVNDLSGGRVPHVHPATALRTFQTLHRAIQQGLVTSCHDLSEGGLAVAAAEMSFAGDLGVNLDLAELAQTSGLANDAVLLFSESNSRLLVEVTAEKSAAFEHLCSGIPATSVGKVTGDRRFVVKSADGRVVIDAEIESLRHDWKRTLDWS